jgi:hypothetical protein
MTSQTPPYAVVYGYLKQRNDARIRDQISLRSEQRNDHKPSNALRLLHLTT